MTNVIRGAGHYAALNASTECDTKDALKSNELSRKRLQEQNKQKPLEFRI